ncbi:hypothetical protein M5Y49_25600 [Escherichia coli]|nr:hypothetical protein [Escherichia coli]
MIDDILVGTDFLSLLSRGASLADQFKCGKVTETGLTGQWQAQQASGQQYS